MPIEIDEDNWKKAILGLVVALGEIIKDAIQVQGMRRFERGKLTDDEIERFGKSLMDLEGALNSIKKEQGIEKIVDDLRSGLDDIVDEVLDKIGNPERWGDEMRDANTTKDKKAIGV